MRIFGAVIFAAALTFMGIAKAVECRRRLRVIQDTLLMLDIIKNELSTNRAPLNRIMQRVEICSRGDVKRFAGELLSAMQSLGDTEFSLIWNEAVSKIFLELPEDCLSELINLGVSLGKYSADMQIEAIERCETIFTINLNELKPQSGNTQKMYIGLYSGVGLIIVVMFI